MTSSFSQGFWSHIHSAVDAPDLAGDVGRGVGGEKVHHACDFLGAPESADGDLLLELFDDFVGYGGGHFGRDYAGGSGKSAPVAAADRGCVPTDTRELRGVSMPVAGVVPDGHGASIRTKIIDLIDKIFI